MAKGTVSKALSRHRDIAEETRQRVIRAADEMGYRPNRLAQALRYSKTHLIGVVIPQMRYKFFNDIAKSVVEAGKGSGYRVIFDSSDDSPEHEKEIVDDYIARRVDGLVIAPCLKGSRPLLERLRDSAHPLVVIDHEIAGLGTSFVGTDFEKAAYLAARHLIDLGHRKIAHLGGPGFLRASSERAAGIGRAIDEAGIAFDERCIMEGRYDSGEARERLRALLEIAPDITSIICANRDISQGVLEEFRVLGASVPGDFSLVDFGNAGDLTSIDQNTEAIGTLAVTMLLRAMDGLQAPATVKVEPRLVVRHSTAAPRVCELSVGGMP